MECIVNEGVLRSGENRSLNDTELIDQKHYRAKILRYATHTSKKNIIFVARSHTLTPVALRRRTS